MEFLKSLFDFIVGLAGAWPMWIGALGIVFMRRHKKAIDSLLSRLVEISPNKAKFLPQEKQAEIKNEIKDKAQLTAETEKRQAARLDPNSARHVHHVDVSELVTFGSDVANATLATMGYAPLTEPPSTDPPDDGNP